MRIDESWSLTRDLDLIGGAGAVGGLSDAELIGRFAERRPGGSGSDSAEVAFEALVRRHGGMVLGTCRRVLRDPDEADDAFQATFLVLARKAGSVRVDGSLAPWLYGVARRVATKARDRSRRRRVLEKKAEVRVETFSNPTADDLGPILFAELDRLPAKYRAPVVLCHLEGLTHEEAGRQLGWPVGTVSGRLSRARDLLRSRLTRRGVAPATLATLAARDASAALMTSTLPGATARLAIRFASGGPVPESIRHLAQGALFAMMTHQIRIWTVTASAVALLTLGAGLVSGQFAGQQPPVQELPDLPKATGNARKSQAAPFGIDQPKLPTLATVEGGSMLVATLPDGRSVSALSLAGGVWREYQVAEGYHSLPILSGDILALGFSGPDVREVAVFDARIEGGTWFRQPLLKPTTGAVVPMVSQDAVIFQVGNDFHAYSGATGKGQWGVLHLPDGEPTTIRFACQTRENSSGAVYGGGSHSVGHNAIVVQQGKKLHVFSILLARWSAGIEPKVFEPKKKEADTIPLNRDPFQVDPTQPPRQPFQLDPVPLRR